MNSAEWRRHAAAQAEEIRRLCATITMLLQPALELTDDEARRLLRYPPTELLRDEDIAQYAERIREWLAAVVEQRDRDRNRQIIEAGCANCGARYDGIIE